MRYFISILCALIFAFPPICRADGAVFGLSRCSSYVQRGVMSFWGRELPISVYVVKKSGGETAMAVDSAAGTLIKGRFSPGAEKCELFVSELLGDKDKVGGLAADIFRLALGFHDSVKARELRVHSVDGKPQFARTENVGVEFSDYITQNGVYLPRVLKIESGFLRIDLRLASSKIGGLK